MWTFWETWRQAVRRWREDERFRESKRVRVAIWVSLALAMYWLLLGSVLPPRYHFKVGQTSPVTIVAPTTAVDTAATEQARAAAVKRVPKQYVQSQAVEIEALNQVDQLFTTAEQVVTDKTMSRTQRLDSLLAVAPRKLDVATLKLLLTVKPSQLAMLQNVCDRIVHTLLDVPFNESLMEEASLLVDRQLLNYSLDRVSQNIVQNVVLSVLRPNMIYQAEATRAAQEQAARSVPPILIHEGQVIVERNGVITPRVLQQLQDVGLLSSNRPNYAMSAGFALYILLSVGLLAAYVEQRSARRRLDNLMLVVLGLVLVMMSVLISVTKTIINDGGPSSIAYLVPVSLGPMLITVLMDASVAVVVAFYLSLLYGAALDFGYWFTVLGFVGSLVGAYSVAKVTHRGTFMRAGFFVSGMNALVILAMNLLQHNSEIDVHAVSLEFGLGLLNGIASAVLTMGILPFLESAFGLLTAIHLLELSNPNHPLLRKLLLEAPGTYHHSLIVGNLAEAAAELVGADPLLCRVGAYYHDVGKTKRPMFFVENQMTKENPHDKIAPSLSHLIITSHVSDGLRMLEEAGLPKPIREICATHHGTTILWYFYNKAREMDKTGTVKVDDFRYPGPKPKTRECAIVMICDAVEAAVRSMSRPTPNRVEGVIRKIIRDRLEDGQLDECDLTLQDLDAMVGAFMKTLKGIYHARIEYPDLDKIRKEVGR
ncbi:HD family phosphohydrolase [Alicyclobacillus cellulosilyticus]|uniref:HD family phosphohydrolase n=1 Tax=Alicyclobacillus cellulosilyticus TaxID=1003997 RepID=A0A917KGN5_9BACL|nr:HDIG domain-containing metalloprotein [Alicyclobacillus cellulosilyticus]GGJ09277.1 HD family phosphohydrolase [Alicyclobacillus cellulosilyticus]